MKRWSFLRSRIQGFASFELASLFLFFGFLSEPEMRRDAEAFANELLQLGYAMPEKPIHIYPLDSRKALPAHAGTWRPGRIYLRANDPTIARKTLRHELAHAFSYSTCKGRLPPWQEEAFALAFEGAASQNDHDLDKLRTEVAHGRMPSLSGIRTLTNLVHDLGWPKTPCARNDKLAALLEPGPADQLSFRLISLYSTRVLDESGSQTHVVAAGSLMKLLYAASLEVSSPEQLDRLRQTLLNSDANALLGLNGFSTNLARARFGLAALPDMGVLAGSRDAKGGFPIEYSLEDLAQRLRVAILMHPERFAGLQDNGRKQGSTLWDADREGLHTLQKLKGMSKTGTTATHRGTPLWGHLAVAWPSERPEFLALFRQKGVNGAAVLKRAKVKLAEWHRRFAAHPMHTQLRILEKIPSQAISLEWPCEKFAVTLEAQAFETSRCGYVDIRVDARTPWPKRRVYGLVSGAQRGLHHLTDRETYADSVIHAEAAHLQGAAKEALRTVIVWNGSRGTHTHKDSSSKLCDLTHCAVFNGLLTMPSSSLADDRLLSHLDAHAKISRKNWLMFEKGGDEPWSKSFSEPQVRQALKASVVLDIVRIRKRSGTVSVQIEYGDSHEIVPCEVFRNTLRLNSCPDAINFDHSKRTWIFSGQGEGHSQGLSMVTAERQAKLGMSAVEILNAAYPLNR